MFLSRLISFVLCEWDLVLEKVHLDVSGLEIYLVQ
jgi:hypothetical protein